MELNAHKNVHEDDGTNSKMNIRVLCLCLCLYFVLECGVVVHRIHMGIVAPEEKKIWNGASSVNSIEYSNSTNSINLNAIANNGNAKHFNRVEF